MSKQTDLINMPDAITVSGSNVGIGTSSPERALHVNSGTGNNVAVFQSTDADARVEIRDSGSSQGYNTISVTANEMYFGTNNTERLRITSSGNLMLDPNSVGNKYARFGTSSTGDGHILLDRGGAHKWQITSGLTNALQFYNYTAGSEIIRFDSDGLKFNGDTAAANALDDYEEGDWTPAPNSGSFSTSGGKYTKVGRVVTVTFDVTVGTGGGSQIILPFSSATTTASAIYTSNQNFAAGRTAFYGVAAGVYMYFRVTGDNVSFATQTLDVGANIHASITYHTT